MNRLHHERRVRPQVQNIITVDIRYNLPMSWRFQFSLRTLALVIALAALPVAAYSHLRERQPTIEIFREEAGQPVTIRAKFFEPSLKKCGVMFVIASYGDQRGATSSTFHDGYAACRRGQVAEARRSCFIVCEAETTYMPERPGRYSVLAMLPGVELQQDFIVESVN